MADRVDVKCVNKSNRQSAHERITHIGGINLSAIEAHAGRSGREHRDSEVRVRRPPERKAGSRYRCTQPVRRQVPQD